MFEREIKFIYDFNLNKVNRLGPYFTFEQLLSSDIHPAILQYISAEIDYLIYEDRQKLLKNSLFDYSGEKISFHFNQISEEAKKTKRFAQEYIAKLILHASSFTVNYLVRPKWTLAKFVFDEESTKSTNDIKQILNYVYYYKYVNKILVSYINSKKILSMNVQEFEDLLNKADKLGVETYLPAILTNALKSMAEFFNIGEIQKTKIPLSAVELFLEEKELIKHLQKVNEVFGNEEGLKFNLNDYQKVFSNVVVEKEELITEPEEPQKFETEEAGEEKHFEEEFEQETGETDQETVDFEKDYEEIEEDEPADEMNFADENKEDLDKEETGFGVDELEEESPEPEDEEEDETSDVMSDEEIEEDEIIEQVKGNEIKITQPAKFRIKINEDSRIEPVIDEPDGTYELPFPAEQDEEMKPEPEEMESDDQAEELPEDENIDEEIENGDFNFKDELKLAEKEFEEDDDESFLKSLRDSGEVSVVSEEEIEVSESSGSVNTKRKVESDELPEAFEEPADEEEFNEEDEEERVIFTDEKFEDDEPEADSRETSGDLPKMDMAEILEHKEMTKIIEVIFDYDIEDFAATLDEISSCRNEDDAHMVINNTLLSRHINRSSKEAQALRSIISEYFNKK